MKTKEINLFIGYNENGEKVNIVFKEAVNKNVLIAAPMGHGEIILLDMLISVALAKAENEKLFDFQILSIGNYREFAPFDNYAPTKYISLEEPYCSKEAASFFLGLQKIIKERQNLLKKHNCICISELPDETGIKNTFILATNLHLLRSEYYTEVLREGAAVGVYLIVVASFINDIISLSDFDKVILVGYKPNTDILKEYMPFIGKLSEEEADLSLELGEALLYDNVKEMVCKVTVPYFSRHTLLEVLKRDDSSAYIDKLLDEKGEKLRTQNFLRALDGQQRVGLFFGAFKYIKEYEDNNKKIHIVVKKEDKKIVKENLKFLFPFGGINPYIALEEENKESARIVISSVKDDEAFAQYNSLSLNEFINKGVEYYNKYEKETCKNFVKVLSGDTNKLNMQYRKWQRMFREFLSSKKQKLPVSLRCNCFYDYLAQLEEMNLEDYLQVRKEFDYYFNVEGEEFAKVLQDNYPILRGLYSPNFELAKNNLQNLIWEYTDEDAYSIMISLVSTVSDSFFTMSQQDVERHVANLDLIHYLYPLIVEFNLSKDDVGALLYNIPQILLFSNRPNDIRLLIINKKIVGCLLVDGKDTRTYWSDSEEMNLLEESDFEEAKIVKYPPVAKEEVSVKEITKLGWVDYYL